jgi:hypothetical protein
MARNPAEPAPADLKPCEGYVMSRGFRDWLAAQVRRELAPQFSGAGLDRLKRVKRRTSE